MWRGKKKPDFSPHTSPVSKVSLFQGLVFANTAEMQRSTLTTRFSLFKCQQKWNYSWSLISMSAEKRDSYIGQFQCNYAKYFGSYAFNKFLFFKMYSLGGMGTLTYEMWTKHQNHATHFVAFHSNYPRDSTVLTYCSFMRLQNSPCWFMVPPSVQYLKLPLYVVTMESKSKVSASFQKPKIWKLKMSKVIFS